jgi:hypothetical protein
MYKALFCLLLTTYAFWAPKGLSRISFLSSNACVAEISPKASYRVEFCRPSFPYVSFDKSMPRFVRFYDQNTQELLGESDIIEMSGRGEVFWPREERLTILVGGGDNSPEMKVPHID